MSDWKEGLGGRMTVLSIDGGGIRGVIPAMVLAELESRTGFAISEMFDLVVGTSTGGILALGLVTPNGGERARSARDLVRLYEEDGSRIFNRSGSHLLASAAGVLAAKYPSEGLAQVLDTYFSGYRLEDALTNVLVTGYDLNAREPLYFSNTIDSAFGKLKMSDIARATSAAPTYFPPAGFEIDRADPEGGKRPVLMVDGGIYANNPSALAYAEARQLAGPGREILVVSLGTGRGVQSLDRLALGWGLAGWSTQIIDLLFEADAEAVHRLMKHLLQPLSERGRKSYYRFQARLETGDERLDQATPENLARLERRAERMIDSETDGLDEVAAELSHVVESRRKLDRELSDYRELQSLEYGDERTDKQREAQERITELAFQSGYSWQRLSRLLEADEILGAVVLLALMQRYPDPRRFKEVLRVIEASPEARMLFDALRALQAMLPLLGREKLAAARLAIRDHQWIKREHVGRWRVAQQVLESIRKEGV